MSVVKAVFTFTASKTDKTDKTESKTGEAKKPKPTGKRVEENTLVMLTKAA